MILRTGVLAMMMAVACSAAQSNPRTPWHVELATSGGITGRGMGTIAVDSDGTITVNACTFKASDEEMRSLEVLLAASKPEKWGNYTPENKCCDRIAYELTYGEDADQHKAEWIDDPLPMPDDLVKVAAELGKLRRAHPCK